MTPQNMEKVKDVVNGVLDECAPEELAVLRKWLKQSEGIVNVLTGKFIKKMKEQRISVNPEEVKNHIRKRLWDDCFNLTDHD